jgi:hypothetical protein
MVPLLCCAAVVLCRVLSGLLAKKLVITAGEEPELPVILAIGGRFAEHAGRLHFAFPFQSLMQAHNTFGGQAFGTTQEEVGGKV